MKEKAYLLTYCHHFDHSVVVKKGIKYSQITNRGWWLDCFISPLFRNLDDQTFDETIEEPLDKLVETVKKELKNKSSITISGNDGYLTICEANTVINLNTDIL